MKTTPRFLTATLFAALAAFCSTRGADDQHLEHAQRQVDDAKPYPATKCLISGEALDSMGKPHILVVDGQELKFCCPGCVKDFEKDKTGYMKKLAEAEAKARPYPLSTCLVSGEAFDHGKPYVFAYQGRQVKLCCKDCLKAFRKNSADYLKKIEVAAKAK